MARILYPDETIDIKPPMSSSGAPQPTLPTAAGMQRLGQLEQNISTPSLRPGYSHPQPAAPQFKAGVSSFTPSSTDLRGQNATSTSGVGRVPPKPPTANEFVGPPKETWESGSPSAVKPSWGGLVRGLAKGVGGYDAVAGALHNFAQPSGLDAYVQEKAKTDPAFVDAASRGVDPGMTWLKEQAGKVPSISGAVVSGMQRMASHLPGNRDGYDLTSHPNPTTPSTGPVHSASTDGGAAPVWTPGYSVTPEKSYMPSTGGESGGPTVERAKNAAAGNDNWADGTSQNEKLQANLMASQQNHPESNGPGWAPARDEGFDRQFANNSSAPEPAQAAASQRNPLAEETAARLARQGGMGMQPAQAPEYSGPDYSAAMDEMNDIALNSGPNGNMTPGQFAAAKHRQQAASHVAAQLANLQSQADQSRQSAAQAYLHDMTTRRGQDMSSADHAATVGATTRGQDLGLQEAMMRSADSRYSTDVGANTQARGQDISMRGQDIDLAGHKMAADAAGYKAWLDAQDKDRQYGLDKARLEDQQGQEMLDRMGQQALLEGQDRANQSRWLPGAASPESGLKEALPELVGLSRKYGMAPKGMTSFFYPAQKPE